MDLAPLLPLAKANSEASELIRSTGRVLVSAAGPLRPYLVAAMVRESLHKNPEHQTVLYCAHQHHAEEWVYSLTGYGVVAHHLPAWDTLPSERLSPAADVIAARMRALAATEKGGGVVVVSARAALYPVPSPMEGLHKSLSLKTGADIEMGTLVEQLIGLGYSREVRVEEPGQIAVRGGLIDIYPPLHDGPVRVEFFGDQVESIRQFDSVSQSSVRDLNRLELNCLREVMVDEVSGPKAAEMLSDQLEQHEWLRRDVERLELGETFDGIEAYLPFLYGARSSISDYLRPGATTIIDEPKFFVDDAVKVIREEGSYLVEATSAGAIPKPPVPYLPIMDKITPDSLMDAASEGRDYSKDVSKNVLSHACVTADCIEFASITLAGGQKHDETFNISGGPVAFTARDHETIASTFDQWRKAGRKVLVAAGTTDSAKRIISLLQEMGLPATSFEESSVAGSDVHSVDRLPELGVTEAGIPYGFELFEPGLVIVSAQDLFGAQQRRTRTGKAPGEAGSTKLLRSLAELEEGDLVVHINHGIGKYTGLVRRDIGDTTREYLTLEFRGADKLFLPVDSIDRITKYVGTGDDPQLAKLGGKEWLRTKNKVKKSLRKIAINLVKLYAERSRSVGHSFNTDSPWQMELEESFPFDETPDQAKAINDVKTDMERERPMDRLVCGDVGYGKTEVALRAAFKAVMDGRQVLILVPTTLLAQQHFSSFHERYEPFPIKVDLLSRFRSKAEQTKVIKGFSSGDIDVVIGTHRALSKDLQAKDLGLVIIDEEHRFGVAQKEHLRELKKQVDVLTMTATPIPRTLQMSLAGIRDLTVIETPPPDRQPVLTFVGEWERTLCRAALMRELAREGQVFYVRNRVEGIESVAQKVRELVPEAKVVVAHGQMSEKELEKIMEEFGAGEHDILVCTSIIESGIDLPNANTLIVEDSDQLGLAQLYQIRGRVGRSGRRAYAYFMTAAGKTLTGGAGERLKTMGELTQLGSGLKLALKDLEIRGAGNLLGGEQHGQIADVGFELYADLLAREVEQLQQAATDGELPVELAADIAAGFADATKARRAEYGTDILGDDEELAEVSIELPVDAFIPEDYIGEEILRIEAYGRIARIHSDEEAEEVTQHLADRFGPPPSAVTQLIDVCRIRTHARRAGIKRIQWKKPVGISGGTLSLAPVNMGTGLWEDIRDEIGRFEWKRLEKIATFPEVTAENSPKIAAGVISCILVAGLNSSE